MVERTPQPSVDALRLIPGPDETLDAICGGEVRVLQHSHGYRFTLDPVLLAHFVALGEPVPSGATCDLGTGCGVIALILARKFGWSDLVALEVQPRLHELARRNVRLNGCEGRIATALGDLREAERLFPRGAFTHVISNPPYQKARCGHLNPDPEKAIARHELHCELRDVTRAAAWMLRDRGLLSIVYPAARLPELSAALLEFGLSPKRMRLVHPRAHRAAKLVLLSATRGTDGPMRVDPPLLVHDSRGFTEEVAQMLGPRQGH